MLLRMLSRYQKWHSTELLFVNHFVFDLLSWYLNLFEHWFVDIIDELGVEESKWWTVKDIKLQSTQAFTLAIL